MLQNVRIILKYFSVPNKSGRHRTLFAAARQTSKTRSNRQKARRMKPERMPIPLQKFHAGKTSRYARRAFQTRLRQTHRHAIRLTSKTSENGRRPNISAPLHGGMLVGHERNRGLPGAEKTGRKRKTRLLRPKNLRRRASNQLTVASGRGIRHDVNEQTKANGAHRLTRKGSIETARKPPCASLLYFAASARPTT